ncbi:hypothetical protein HZS_8154 [Henneguya salminicola]|nr:hypothetical protein HZS_8154 [Henneguya salminicola]
MTESCKRKPFYFFNTNKKYFENSFEIQLEKVTLILYPQKHEVWLSFVYLIENNPVINLKFTIYANRPFIQDPLTISKYSCIWIHHFLAFRFRSY